MAKFFGPIGFSTTTETAPGVWEESIIEKKYYGDILQFSTRWENSDKLNDNLNISNKISIISDLFANNNCGSMRYIEFMGAKWKISNIEVQYPRLILTIGGVYNA